MLPNYHRKTFQPELLYMDTVPINGRHNGGYFVVDYIDDYSCLWTDAVISHYEPGVEILKMVERRCLSLA